MNLLLQVQRNMTESIKVFVRFRPSSDEPTWTWDENTVTGSDHTFSFDGVLPMDVGQPDVYARIGRPLVHQILDGFNACVLAYGQTASGKTHTMTGVLDDPDAQGLIPRMVQDLLISCTTPEPDIEFQVAVSYVEIYQEQLRDLLETDSTKTLKIREHEARPGSPLSVYIENGTSVTVTSTQQVMDLLRKGGANRAVAGTQMNEHSSRSHAVFILQLTKTDKRLQKRKLSRLFLVDLAGSEQVDRSGVTGQALQEAMKINQSLSTLARVIHSLTSDRSHVPYRDSKLTRLLSDTLGGNSKTVLLLACAAAKDCTRETLSTLQFGQRAKMIKNTPKMNEEVSIRGYQLMVAQLEERLKQYENKELEHTLAEKEACISEKEACIQKLQADKEACIQKLQADKEACIQNLQADKEACILKLQSDKEACMQELHATLSAMAQAQSEARAQGQRDDGIYFQLDRVFRIQPDRIV